MASTGVRIGVVGATGSLGMEILNVLGRSSLRVSEVVPIATDASIGEVVDFQDEEYPVVAAEPEGPALPTLHGLDLVILCAPPAVSLEYARHALAAEVPCIDASGALASSGEVPLAIAALSDSAGIGDQPVIAAPAGATLPWALVLKPLQDALGLRRVVGTVLDAASAWGARAIETLHTESIAIFNQAEVAEPELFGVPVAFDCLPVTRASGAVELDGATPRENALLACMGQLLGPEVGVGVTCVQVPSFLGQSSSLSIEAARPVDAKQAEELLASAGGVRLWPENTAGPSMRVSSGLTEVLVGRVRVDASAANALSLWLSCDVISLAAANAVELAARRLPSS